MYLLLTQEQDGPVNYFFQAFSTLQDSLSLFSFFIVKKTTTTTTTTKNFQLLLTQPVAETQSCSTKETSSYIVYIWKTRWFMRVNITELKKKKKNKTLKLRRVNMRYFYNQYGEIGVDLSTFLHQNNDIHSVRVTLLLDL